VSRDHLHFVTGRLARHALRDMVEQVAEEQGFDFTIDVLPITVAALMTPQWVAKHIQIVEAATKVILPGYCAGDLSDISAKTGLPVELGPSDLRRLPEHFGGKVQRDGYGEYTIEIIAEINHAPRLVLKEILAQARLLAADGADVIDVGCDPGGNWAGVAECVRALRDEGHRVSIDSLNPQEIAPAVAAGAELVLSVNSTNREAAPDWGTEVVVIPDDFATLGGLEENIEFLAERDVPLRIDAILEPIGFGFAASLRRYMEVRQRYPDAAMMMGIGNLTELTDVDSAGINVMLLACCEELGIQSVLTTQVINWARTSVRECDLARRLLAYAIRNQVPPKRLDTGLVCLRDPKVDDFGAEQLQQLAADLKDTNYRIFAEAGELHIMNGQLHLQGGDPFVLFDQLLTSGADGETPRKLDASHAFYLGYEMAKAVTALTLGKQYRQDEALSWGYLTKPEISHRQRKEGNE